MFILKKFLKFIRNLILKLPQIISTKKPLIINDFSGYNQPYHPSVLYFEKGFNGYKYWMVQTPFPIGGIPYRDRWECPCIYWSNNGIAWQTDTKVNPIDNITSEQILTGDFLSDPHLVYRHDTKTLECWYRITNMNKSNPDIKLQYPTYLLRKTSKNGLDWSEREILIDLQDSNNTLDNMVRSPSIICDNNIYKMWYVDTLPTLSNRNIVYAESNNGHTWTNKIVTNMDFYIDPWHIDVNYFDGKYHLINYTLIGNKGLNYYESSDGINFKFIKEILKPSLFSFYSNGLYRSCIIKANDTIRVYFSAFTHSETSLGILQGNNIENLKVINGRIKSLGK